MSEARPLPPMENMPAANFEKPRFEALIAQKGVKVLWERAIACPCKSKGGDNLSSCRNCFGTGWVFVNPVETIMVIQSINIDTKFKSWSEERSGTVSLTARDIDQFAFMDRVTLVDTKAIMSQILHPTEVGGILFARTLYDISEIYHFFEFKADDQPLAQVSASHYQIQGRNTIIFDKTKYAQTGTLTFSLTYRYPLQFHVIDLVNEMRKTTVYENNEFQEVQMPVHAIARRTHYVLDKDNLSGTLLIKNG